jgi:hypothetical protein
VTSVPEDPKPPQGLLRLVASRALDAELGALLWTLREGGVPALVIGPVGEDAVPVVADALEQIEQSSSGGTESDFEARTEVVTQAHAQVRTLRATSLKEAFEILADDPFHFSDDAVRSLGLVLVVHDGRIAAAHYLRPVERDREGHLQRRPPAVLATWEEGEGRFEHFSWAVTPELAARVNESQAALEEETAKRARLLAAADSSPSRTAADR